MYPLCNCDVLEFARVIELDKMMFSLMNFSAFTVVSNDFASSVCFKPTSNSVCAKSYLHNR